MMKSMLGMLGIKENELKVIEELTQKVIENRDKLNYLLENLDVLVNKIKGE